MNKIYKVVYSAVRGCWIVTGEFSRAGRKTNLRKKTKKTIKTKKIILSFYLILSLIPVFAFSETCSTTTLSFNSTATEGVFQCYISGVLQDSDNDGSIDGVDSTDSANYKNKNQTFSNDTVFSLSNGIQWYPTTNGPTTSLPVTAVSASELFKRGALTVSDMAGNQLSSLPQFMDWDLNGNNTRSLIMWKKSDGSTGTASVYDTSTLAVTKNIDSATNFSASIVTGQPTQPFYNLTLATADNNATLQLVSDGVLNSDGFAIDWNPGQVKNSSLFVANNATINQSTDTPIRVVFSYTDGVGNPANSGSVTGSFGPQKVLSGSQINFNGVTYTIDSASALDNYNQALITAIRNNTLTSSDYDSWFQKAFTAGKAEYTYTYTPTGVSNSSYYISQEMSAAIGKRAIFETTGTGVVNLNANVAAIGQTWAPAYNVWGHDGGSVNNKGGIIVDSPDTQNALITSGATFNNSGTITFDVNGTNWADQVSGSSSKYINDGLIAVSTSTQNDANAVHPNRYYKTSRNIATEILDGASGENKGRYIIGFDEPSLSPGTATGVHITNYGTFTNNGVMNIGKDGSGNTVTLNGGSPSEILNIDNSYNAISAYVNNDKSILSIYNKGTIDISNTARNSVAINVGEDPVLFNTSGSVFEPHNVTVSNSGTINVEGANSAGLKAAGGFTIANNDNITNTGIIAVSGAGSSGIFSASGAEITNNGSVTLIGSDTLSNRAYGIRADNAKVNLEGNSNLTLLNSYTTGLYARTGGQILVNGGTITVPEDSNTTDQVVFWISGINNDGLSSAISFSQPTSYTLENSRSTLFRIDQGATYDGSSSNLQTVKVEGNSANGYSIATKGTSFISGGTTINVDGENATGINVNSGAGTDGLVSLTNNTTISVSGKNATVATVDGNTYDLMGNVVGQDGAKLLTEAALTAGASGKVADNAIGYKVINGGELMQNGTIDFSSASDTTGIYIDGGTLTNNGQISSNGIGIDVYQTGLNTSHLSNTSTITATNGIAAIRLNKNAALEVGGTGVISSNGTSDAIRVMSGASLTTNNAVLKTDGSGSGIHFLNTADDSTNNIFHLVGSGSISVSGANAAGITLEGQDSNGNPALSSANMDTRGSENLLITVADKGGSGIVTNTSGYIYSGTSVDIQSADGESALLIKGLTTDIQQSGNLSSFSNSSAVVSLNQSVTSPVQFINSGIIDAKGNGAAIDGSLLTANLNLINSANGKITGVVNLGNGDNNITLKNMSNTESISSGDGSNNITLQDNAVLTGKIVSGNGNNTVILKDNSKTKMISLGNGKNNIDIYGGTTNGSLSSGSGDDNFTLHNVNTNNLTPEQSDNAFVSLNAGAGNNSLTITDSSWYVLNKPDSIINFTGLNVTNNSTFELDNIDFSLLNSGSVSLDKLSTYFINYNDIANDYNLTRDISGSGTIKTDTNGNSFYFNNANYESENFTGVLALSNGKFILSGDNTTALANSTLQLDTNGQGILLKDQPQQIIGGLKFNNGNLLAQANMIGSQEDSLKSHLQVNNLDVKGTGLLQITASGFDNNYNAQEKLADLSRKTLLNQDDGITLVTIVKATGSVDGNASGINLSLVDADGNTLSGSRDDQLQDIIQGNQKVAIGTYGLGSSTGEMNDGLYAAYRLKKLDIIDGETINLVTGADDTKNGLDLSAQLSGAGNINVLAGGQYLSLSNSNNDYTGITSVVNGKLLLSDNMVLGQQGSYTQALNLINNSVVDFSGTTQFVGQLNTTSNSHVFLENGTLNIMGGGNVYGNISADSSGELLVNNGVLNITSSNSNYHALTQVFDPATINIYTTSGLGDGDIDISGVLNLVKVPADNLVNRLSGAGKVNLIDGSDITLSGDNAKFNGNISIDKESTLRAASPNNLGVIFTTDDGLSSSIHNQGRLILTDDLSTTWTVNNLIDGSGDLYKQGAGLLQLTSQSTEYTGKTFINQGAITAGSISSPVTVKSSVINIAATSSFSGYGSVAGDINNNGDFFPGTTLGSKVASAIPVSYKVNGSVVNAGNIYLGQGDSIGNILSIGGDYISQGGALYLNTVLNKGFQETATDQVLVGGSVRKSGNATRLFLRNIAGQGAYTQPDAIKLIDVKGISDNNAFVLGNPVAIGPYEYVLSKGTQDSSWYLSSYNPAFPPGENRGQETLRYVNPLIGSFAANQNALSLFNMTLHDRLGQPQYAESLHDDNAFAHSLWLRVVDTHQSFNTINNQLQLDGNSNVTQLGHDLIHWSDSGNWRGRVGVMGGIGNQNFTIESRRTGSQARANIEKAYSGGIYGTLFHNDKSNLSSSYVDSWALYNKYRNHASMSGYSDTAYSSHGYNLSLEAGHTFVLTTDAQQQDILSLVPQAQLTYGQLTTEQAQSDTGLTIAANRSYSLQSRVGARLSYLHNFSSQRTLQPFIEANWRHEFRQNSLTVNEKYDFENQQPANRYEMKLGLEGQRNKNLNGWVNISYSLGDNKFREPQAMIGIKYQW